MYQNDGDSRDGIPRAVGFLRCDNDDDEMPLPAWIYVEKWNAHEEELAIAGIIRARSGCRLLTLGRASGVKVYGVKAQKLLHWSVVGCMSKWRG